MDAPPLPLLHFEPPLEDKEMLWCQSISRFTVWVNKRVDQWLYFCAEVATTCEALNLKDGVSALQSVVLFLLKVPPHGGLEEKWLGPWSMHMLKYALNVLCLWPHSLSLLKVCRPRFEPRAALENCYRISSCKQLLTVRNAYFWLDCCIFLHGKKNPPDSTVEQSQPAVKCCF